MVDIGFVGIGRMGLPVAANLAAAGHHVLATDRRAELSVRATDAGLTWKPSARQVARGADVLITMLPGPPECRAAMLDADGGVHGLRSGATWIDLTSNSPAVAAAIAAQVVDRGADVLEAPVGGGVEAATNGSLTLYVGGDLQVLDRHRTLLQAVSDDIRYVGGAGTGYVTKLLVNQLWFGQAVATAEVMLLATRLGLDLTAVQHNLATGPAASEFIARYLPRLLEGDYLPTFGIDRVVEELRTIDDLAHDHSVPFSVNRAVLTVHERALDRYGPVDGELTAVAMLEEEAGKLIRHS